MELSPIIPYLTVDGAAKAIDWYVKIFGAKEEQRMKAQDGEHLMHVHLTINGGALFMADPFPEYDGSPAPSGAALPSVSVVLNVPKAAQVDDTFKRAIAAGAKAQVEPRDEFWGARFAVLVCPFGHRWLLSGMLEKK